MEKQKFVKEVTDKYGAKNVIIATPLMVRCQCNKGVVVLPSNDLFCSHCYGFWKEEVNE